MSGYKYQKAQLYTILYPSRGKIQKTEEKAVLVEYGPENLHKVEWMLKKSDIKEYKFL